MLIVNFSVCSNEPQRKENALPRTLREKFFQIWKDLWQSFYWGQRIPWPLNLSLGDNADDLCKESTTNVLMSQTNKQTKKITFNSNKRAGSGPELWVSLNLNLKLLRLHFDFLQERVIHRIMWKHVRISGSTRRHLFHSLLFHSCSVKYSIL